MHATNRGSNARDQFACNTHANVASGARLPLYRCAGTGLMTLRAIRYRAFSHAWAFHPWFHCTFRKGDGFKAGPFVPLPDPAEATAALHAELARLRDELSASQSAAKRAQIEPDEPPAPVRGCRPGGATGRPVIHRDILLAGFDMLTNRIGVCWMVYVESA